MTSMDQFALLSGIDDDLILDAIPPVWLGAVPPKPKRFVGFYDRFMSSGWVAAVLSVVVALGVLTGIVMFTRGGTDDPTPGGTVAETESPPLAETESLPLAETESLSLAETESLPLLGEDFLWIIKDGRSDYVVEIPARGTVTDTVHSAALTLQSVIEKEFGLTLPEIDPSEPVDDSHILRVAVDETLGDYGYRILVSDTNVTLYASAEQYQSFTYAINRLLADGKVEGGLRLERDYEVKVVEYESHPVIETEPEPEPEIFTSEDYRLLQGIAEQDLLLKYPPIAKYGMDSFSYRRSTLTGDSEECTVYFTYYLAGVATEQQYRLTYVKENGTIRLTNHSSSHGGEFTAFHDICTPEMMKAAIAELAEISGDDYYYLEVNDEGQLLVSTEVIVSITPPPDAEFSAGCGIDHEHRFYSVVVCDAPTKEENQLPQSLPAKTDD